MTAIAYMKNERVWELLARKMSGEATSGELEELQELLRNDPHLHFSVQAFADLWKHSTSKNKTESKDAYSRHLQRMRDIGIHPSGIESAANAETVLLSGSRKTPVLKYVIAIAASLIILAGGTWFFLDNNKTQPVTALSADGLVNEVSTKYGSKTRVQLPDGSQVWLNAGSKLNYNKDFGKDVREVQLIGEGFFDVVKNPQKPFIIHTASIDVKVLGTQFNVRSYPGDKTTETSLVHGSVEVVVRKRPDEKYILKPNEKIVVLNEDSNALARQPKSKTTEPIIAIRQLTYKEGDSVAVETEWTYNKLSFEDETFDEVAKKMERWYDVHFEFRGRNIQATRIKGSLINETLPQAMEALKYANRFQYEIEGKTVIVY